MNLRSFSRVRAKLFTGGEALLDLVRNMPIHLDVQNIEKIFTPQYFRCKVGTAWSAPLLLKSNGVSDFEIPQPILRSSLYRPWKATSHLNRLPTSPHLVNRVKPNFLSIRAPPRGVRAYHPTALQHHLNDRMVTI